ncbi:threonine-phosphate decarboxylase [Desulfotomaculum copahuensis]|uniref:threonine-phosphate decarboxylase n=2 Tax=Desulfotomaculum copahuensis TaxID=1838280 RepID=A0A1B7LJM2_9FIRM|nr:threonine-phosphate decarboxylase [Desulfotomaculum copahuensis]
MDAGIPPHGGNLVRAAREYGLSPRDFLDFSANINPLGPSPAALQAIRDNLWQIRHYPDPDCRELKAALSRYLKVDQDCLLTGNGVAELIYLLARVLDIRRALAPAPTFSEYGLAVKCNGGVMRYAVADPAGGFVPPVAELLRLLPENDALFICTPNNPTGALVERRELEQLLDAAAGCGAMVIVDEAFMDFVPEREQYSLLPRAGQHPNLILLYSLTKFFALPGLRLGALAAPPPLIRRLKEARDPWSVNALAQVAGTTGLADKEYMAATRRLVAEEQVWLRERLNALPGINVRPGAANFLLVDAGAAGCSATELVHLLGRRGVLVRDCSNFPGLRGAYIRVAVRRREENRVLVEALAAVLNGDRT